MRHPARVLLSAMLLAGLLAACSGGDDGGGFVEPTTTISGGDAVVPTGKLVGMQGTVPLSELSADFRERLAEVAPTLEDPAFAAEAYDSVVLLGLAVESARSDAPGRFVSEIVRSSADGLKCPNWQLCKDITDVLGDVDYDGVSGAIQMLASREPGEASFGVMRFDEEDRLERIALKTATAEPPPIDLPAPQPSFGPRADGVLRLGMLLPKDGPAATLGEAQRAGVRLAVKEINGRGGVLGRPIDLIDGDSGQAGDGTAAATATDLLEDGVDAIIGPASADVALEVIDQVIDAGVVMISPSISTRLFAFYPDRGLFFRMAPSDVLQGQVLAEVAAGDGVLSALVLAQRGAYGDGVTQDFRAAFEKIGGRIAAVIQFDADSVDPAVLNAALATQSEAVVLFGDPEPSGALITSLSTGGRGPGQVPYYMGNISSTLAQYVN